MSHVRTISYRVVEGQKRKPEKLSYTDDAHAPFGSPAGSSPRRGSSAGPLSSCGASLKKVQAKSRVLLYSPPSSVGLLACTLSEASLPRPRPRPGDA